MKKSNNNQNQDIYYLLLEGYGDETKIHGIVLLDQKVVNVLNYAYALNGTTKRYEKF